MTDRRAQAPLPKVSSQPRGNARVLVTPENPDACLLPLFPVASGTLLAMPQKQ